MRICELSEKDPEINVVTDVVAENPTATHADYEVFVQAMAFSVLAQDVREAFGDTVAVRSDDPDLPE